MTTKTVAAALICTLTLGGCASTDWVNGHTLETAESLAVLTLPAGATVTTEYGDSCTSPCKVPLLTKRGGEVTVELAGYCTERHRITSSVSDSRVARRATSYAIEASDPDPVSIGLTALGDALTGKSGVMAIDKRKREVEMVALADGEEDLPAPAEPLTGERIPIDLGEPAVF